MKLVLEIELDNAAFTLDPADLESDRSAMAVVLCLEEALVKMETRFRSLAPGVGSRIHDVNGNCIGGWEVKDA